MLSILLVILFDVERMKILDRTNSTQALQKGVREQYQTNINGVINFQSSGEGWKKALAIILMSKLTLK